MNTDEPQMNADEEVYRPEPFVRDQSLHLRSTVPLTPKNDTPL